MSSETVFLLNRVVPGAMYVSLLCMAVLAHRKLPLRGFIPLIVGLTILVEYSTANVMARTFGAHADKVMTILTWVHIGACCLVVIGAASVVLSLKREFAAEITQQHMALKKPINNVIATIVLVAGFPASLAVASATIHGPYAMPFLGAVMLFAFIIVPIGAVLAMVALCRREKWLPLTALNVAACIVLIALAIKEMIK